MKKISVLILFLICGLLCACKTSMDKTIATENTIDQAMVQDGSTQPITSEKDQNAAPKYSTVDIDLSSMSGTIAYSQVYDMLCNPLKYEGKIVKMQGPFYVLYSSETKLYYPAVIIKDATACCAQGIEFVLYGNPEYPLRYPKTDDEITVIGKFEIYYEGPNMFCHLVNSIIV